MSDLHKWDVEDEQFWESEGKKIAHRNLWISIPSLLNGFAVWLYWGIITVQMLNLGFPYEKSQLFTLMAIAGLTGATYGEKSKAGLMQLEPLKDPRVWRFATYYFFVFGGFVALALWLPRYYMGGYGLEIQTAGMLAAAYALPSSIFRALGGWMSDKIGARKVMYITFISGLVCLFFLSYPATDYSVHGINGPINFTIAIGLVPFVILTIFLGFFMSLGMGAVYKHIPAYYPDHVGSVGGLVGLIGGLGGFILPICFGLMNDIIGVWTSYFMLLFVIAAISLVWMHTAIIISNRKHHPELKAAKDLPELLED